MGLRYEIERDGESHVVEVELSLDPGDFTLQELRRLAKVVGDESVTRMLEGKGQPLTIELLTAAVWLQLARYVPDLSIDDVDLPLSDVVQGLRKGRVVKLPMQTPDGQVEVGEVAAAGNG